MSTTERRPVTLVVPPTMWREFREAVLLDSRTREVMAFFFCTEHRSRREIRLLPKAWVVPDEACYERQSVAGLELRQAVHKELLTRYVLPGLRLVHIHTHPGESAPHFSAIDDAHEEAYARFLADIRPGMHLVSGVFNESVTRHSFRVWDARDGAHYRQAYFQPSGIPGDMHVRGENSPLLVRQQVFGEGFQRALSGLTVGLVGCGGIGAVFAELLSRLGVRRWVLVDDDRLDLSNLNRMPGATVTDARRRIRKTAFVESVIRKMWGEEARVSCINSPLTKTTTSHRAIVDCDLLVAATDNHASRAEVQKLALRYVRPILSLGTDISVVDDEPRLLCRVTMPPLGQGWCLMCAGVVSLQTAAMEEAPAELSREMRSRGYISDVPAPAVYWLNSLCASAGVSVIHRLLVADNRITDGVDWILDAQNNEWIQVSHDGEERECFFCALDGGIWAEAGGGMSKAKGAQGSLVSGELTLS